MKKGLAVFFVAALLLSVSIAGAYTPGISDTGPSSLGRYADNAREAEHIDVDEVEEEIKGIPSENNSRVANLTGPAGAPWTIPPNTPSIKKFPEPSVSAETQGDIVLTEDDISRPEPIPDNVPIVGDKSDQVSAWDTALADLKNQTAGNSPCNCTLETVTVTLAYRCNSTV